MSRSGNRSTSPPCSRSSTGSPTPGGSPGMDRDDLDLVPLGDRAWLARFPDESSARGWALAVRRARLPGVLDVVLAYRSASVHVDPGRIDWEALERQLREMESVAASGSEQLWRVSV